MRQLERLYGRAKSICVSTSDGLDYKMPSARPHEKCRRAYRVNEAQAYSYASDLSCKRILLPPDLCLDACRQHLACLNMDAVHLECQWIQQAGLSQRLIILRSKLPTFVRIQQSFWGCDAPHPRCTPYLGISSLPASFARRALHSLRAQGLGLEGASTWA